MLRWLLPVLTCFSRLAIGVLRWTPFLLSYAIVYFFWGGLGWVPSAWNCVTDSSRSIHLLNIDFRIDVEDCAQGIVTEPYAWIRAKQHGDWFSTGILEFDGAVDQAELEAIDDHTIRVVVPTVSASHEIRTGDAGLQRHRWRGVTFLYEWRYPDAEPK